MKIKLVFAGLTAFTVGLILSGTIRVVPTGETGVRVRMGQVQEETVSSGIHLKIPFVEKIKKVDNKQKELTYSGQCWAESNEQTPVFYEDVVVSYRISPSASAWLYSNVDKNFNKDGQILIPSAVLNSALKNAASTLDTRSVTKRNAIEPLATKELQSALDEKYGEDSVIIVKLSITNADFEQSYNDIIAERQAAQIKYEQQEIENKTAIEKAKADAEKKKLDAEGEAEAIKVKSQAEADAKIVAANAEAEANKKIRESLTEEVLANNMITKWDGKLPKVQSGDSGIMFDTSGFVSDTE